MFIHDNPDGTRNVILDPGETITVEMAGGNGVVYTITSDSTTGTIKDDDGYDITALAYYR